MTFDSTLERTLVERWTVTTCTGSEYTILRDDVGHFWLSGTNVPNPFSCELPADRMYRIEQPSPWPLETGRALWLIADTTLEIGHPDRCPGGGKRTSSVQHYTYERLV